VDVALETRFKDARFLDGDSISLCNDADLYTYLLKYCGKQDVLGLQGMPAVDIAPVGWQVTAYGSAGGGLLLVLFAVAKSCIKHRRSEGSTCGFWLVALVPCGRPYVCACCRAGACGRADDEPGEHDDLSGNGVSEGEGNGAANLSPSTREHTISAP
jgi:hypothetical protein